MNRTAKTENGLVRGLPAADPRITSFKGIPFASPPTGKNRWRAPQPCGNWDGVLDAFRFAPISVQDIPGKGGNIYDREWHVDPEIEMNEDCLYLNVWTNSLNPEAKLPVLVWFFGGGLQWGYTSEMEFDGERIARRGIVVVTVNYRLNAFGFMAHRELTGEQPDAPANFGHLDQQAGLRWVTRNIAAFGGDPANITIAGQSAGGGSVTAQLACPGNEGLIKNAVIMSGMFHNPYMENSFMRPLELEKAEENGKSFLDFLGVASIAEARELDAFFVRDKYAEYAKTNMRMGPVIDGAFMPGGPVKGALTNKSVSIMAGNTGDEFLNTIKADTEDELQKKAVQFFGGKADEFLGFKEAREKDKDGGYAPVSGIEYCVKAFFEKRAPGGGAYYYRFDADIPGWDNPGTFHSVDLWFFFETLAKCWRPFTGRHYDLARQMCDYLCNFIKTGNPNGKDNPELPLWEEYKAGAPNEMVFTPGGSAACKARENGFGDFIKSHIAELI